MVIRKLKRSVTKEETKTIIVARKPRVFKEENNMGMVVQHNMSAANANRQLGISSSSLAKSTEKLSSGYKINRAGDNAAGLAISEKMRGQIRGLNQASANSEDGISLIQTAEGALQESQNLIQRMRELAVQAASDTNTDDDREQIQNEISQLTQEVDRIANTTEFNTKKLLDGSQAGSTTFNSGKTKVEGTFVNGKVSVRMLTSAGNTSALATCIDDVIRIEYTEDGGAGKYNIASLNGNAVSIVSGTITIASAAYAGSRDEVRTGTSATLTTKTSIVFSVSNVGQIKAGDVITINLQKATITKSATTGKESLRLQIGANGGQELEVSIASMKAKDLGITQTSSIITLRSAAQTAVASALENKLNLGAALDVTSQSSASLAIEAYDNALQKVSAERAKLGAKQNRLEHTINNLDTASENLQSAESRIRDVDMADEMTVYSKYNILQQAGQSMLSQANNSTQGVLSLLQG